MPSRVKDVVWLDETIGSLDIEACKDYVARPSDPCSMRLYETPDGRWALDYGSRLQELSQESAARLLVSWGLMPPSNLQRALRDAEPPSPTGPLPLPMSALIVPSPPRIVPHYDEVPNPEARHTIESSFAKHLRKRKWATPARLVEAMFRRDTAPIGDIGDKVHDDPYASSKRVGENCTRTTREAEAILVPLRYFCRGGLVFKDWHHQSAA